MDGAVTWSQTFFIENFLLSTETLTKEADEQKDAKKIQSGPEPGERLNSQSCNVRSEWKKWLY